MNTHNTYNTDAGTRIPLTPKELHDLLESHGQRWPALTRAEYLGLDDQQHHTYRIEFLVEDSQRPAIAWRTIAISKNGENHGEVIVTGSGHSDLD